MYVIFVHITGLALIEILFYFFYIGNMETQMFIKNIQHLLHNENLNIDYHMYNISTWENYNQTYVDYYETRSQNGRYERIKDNNKLFTEALMGFIVILTVTTVVMVTELVITKGKNIKKVSSIDSVNNVCLEMVEFNETRNMSVAADNVNDQNDQPKKYGKIAIHAILYAGLMVAFEYWFFNQIIMKYKVISNEEIEYLFAEKMSTMTP